MGVSPGTGLLGASSRSAAWRPFLPLGLTSRTVDDAGGILQIECGVHVHQQVRTAPISLCHSAFDVGLSPQGGATEVRMTQRHLAIRRSRTKPNPAYSCSWPGVQEGSLLRCPVLRSLGVHLGEGREVRPGVFIEQGGPECRPVTVASYALIAPVSASRGPRHSESCQERRPAAMDLRPRRRMVTDPCRKSWSRSTASGSTTF